MRILCSRYSGKIRGAFIFMSKLTGSMSRFQISIFVQSAFDEFLLLMKTFVLRQPLFDFVFSRHDIAAFHTTQLGSDAGAHYRQIDGQTWNDLLLDQYLDFVSPCTSIFGKQMLFHRLKLGMDERTSFGQTERLKAWLQTILQTVELLKTCAALREADTEISGLLFSEKKAERAPSWSRYLGTLVLLLPLSLGLAFFSAWAWLVVGVTVCALLLFQCNYHFAIVRWDAKMKTVQLLLRTVSMLALASKKDQADSDGALKQFFGLAADAGRLNRALSTIRVMDFLPFAREYLDWFALGNLRHYFMRMELVARHREFLGECYLACANLEADLALARHLETQPQFCWALSGMDREIQLDNFTHPLMQNATPLSISLKDTGAFISGRNGIGKSTLLRSVGINLICARAFGFCYASAAIAPQLPVYASLQNEDSLLDGESLYIAELRRARELLNVCEGGTQAVYLIDEIFRGTNHLESIAAATAVLEILAKRDAVLVSSHNLVLATLLKDHVIPLCVYLDEENLESIEPDDPRGIPRLKLKSGILHDTNGISLLAQYGFSSEISDRAKRVAGDLGKFFLPVT